MAEVKWQCYEAANDLMNAWRMLDRAEDATRAKRKDAATALIDFAENMIDEKLGMATALSKDIEDKLDEARGGLEDGNWKEAETHIYNAGAILKERIFKHFAECQVEAD